MGEFIRLFFQNTCLGKIEDLFFAQPEVHGTFNPSVGIEEFQRLFAWMVDEDNLSEEPPFDDDRRSGCSGGSIRTIRPKSGRYFKSIPEVAKPNSPADDLPIPPCELPEVR